MGPQHPDTLECVANLASLLKKSKKKKEAERFFRRAMLGRDIELGGSHPVLLNYFRMCFSRLE